MDVWRLASAWWSGWDAGLEAHKTPLPPVAECGRPSSLRAGPPDEVRAEFERGAALTCNKLASELLFGHAVGLARADPLWRQRHVLPFGHVPRESALAPKTEVAASSRIAATVERSRRDSNP